MLFTTFPQLLALLLLFVAGLFLGLGLHPGGAKWRKRFKDESDNYAAFRRVADKAQRESGRRIGELEDEIETLRDRLSTALTFAEASRPTPAAKPGVAPVAASAPAPAIVAPVIGEPPIVVAPEPVPRPATDQRDLLRIRGIDPVLKTKLFALGVTEYGDIENLSAEDEMALEQRLAIPAGYITREQWREQARLLRTGQVAEQAERFPPY